MPDSLERVLFWLQLTGKVIFVVGCFLCMVIMAGILLEAALSGAFWVVKQL